MRCWADYVTVTDTSLDVSVPVKSPTPVVPTTWKLSEYGTWTAPLIGVMVSVDVVPDEVGMISAGENVHDMVAVWQVWTLRVMFGRPAVADPEASVAVTAYEAPLPWATL
jgi:hypothetical protein